jgi:hypothetical protein
MTWFNEKQVMIVARDLHEADQTLAMGMETKAWGELSEPARQAWVDRARTRLAAINPIDITKPLKLRDGTAVGNVRLSEDGLQIVATIPSWATDATWPLDGLLEEQHPSDLVYAEMAPAD